MFEWSYKKPSEPGRYFYFDPAYNKRPVIFHLQVERDAEGRLFIEDLTLGEQLKYSVTTERWPGRWWGPIEEPPTPEADEEPLFTVPPGAVPFGTLKQNQRFYRLDADANAYGCGKDNEPGQCLAPLCESTDRYAYGRAYWRNIGSSTHTEWIQYWELVIPVPGRINE